MSKYKIEIDRDLCIGDQMCCNEAPNCFEMDDEDKAIIGNPDGDTDEEILAAAQSCPTDAIILTENGEKIWPED
jgi:ferredoxin